MIERMKNGLKLILKKNWLKRWFSFGSWLIWALSSLALTVMIEVIHRFSFQEGMLFLKDYPFAFCLNLLIVSLTLSFMLMVSRKYFILIAISLVWVVLALGNGVITQSRGMPFMFSDFFLIQEGLSVAGSYLDIQLILLLMIGLVGSGIILIKMFNLKKKPKILDYCLSFVYLIFGVVSLYLAYTDSWLVPINWDYMTSYNQQGFPYSFLNTIYPYLERGVDGYSKDAMAEIQSRLVGEEAGTTNQPNVIYVQLESFMDPLEFEGVEYSFDPIPTFRAMLENLGGYMNAPTFGGGTVRTEFEVLTGMDLDLMKPGEIPNNQILRTTAVESLASYLVNKGYHSTAIHNFQGAFYNRDAVYGNLGFNTFISLEFMQSDRIIDYVTQTDDSMLVDYIIKSLESTPNERDFIFAVSTGPHGPYGEREGYAEHPLQVTTIEDEEYKASLQDLIIRFWNLDVQLKRLIEYVETLEEETIIVAYSDHFPSISILEDEGYGEDIDKYRVPYGIYSNFDLNEVEVQEEIEAYQLSTYVYDLIGLTGGLMNQVHRLFAETEDYKQVKALVQYDLLEGKKYLYSSKEKPVSKTVQLGLNEIEPTEAFITGTTLIVNGINFNPSTYIWVNGERLSKPSFLATTQLAVDLSKTKIKTMDDIRSVEIAQVGRYDKRMGTLINVPLKK